MYKIILAFMVLLSAQVNATCPSIPTGWLKDILAGKSYPAGGYVYKPINKPATTVEKVKNFITTSKNYRVGAKLEEIEPFATENANGKLTCSYRIKAGLSKQDTMLVLEGSKAPGGAK